MLRHHRPASPRCCFTHHVLFLFSSPAALLFIAPLPDSFYSLYLSLLTVSLAVSCLKMWPWGVRQIPGIPGPGLQAGGGKRPRHSGALILDILKPS